MQYLTTIKKLIKKLVVNLIFYRDLNLIKKKETNIKNFATFKIINKADRIGRNPKNKKIYKIKARKSLSFITSKNFNDKFKNL